MEYLCGSIGRESPQRIGGIVVKILILMPCDEQHVYAAEGVYQALPTKLREKTFAMPMFMEYLVVTKQSEDWIGALFYSLLAAKKLFLAAEKDPQENLIIIGNASVDLQFDAVFSFQDIDESMDYKDLFIEKLINLVADEELLVGQLKNLHTQEKSLFNLTNCVASADFIAKYIKTDVKHKLEKLKKEYEEQLKEITKLKGVKLDVFPTSKQK